MYGLEILQQRGKRVKSKSQTVLGASSYVCRSYRGKTSREEPFCVLILNRVKGLTWNTFATIFTEQVLAC